MAINNDSLRGHTETIILCQLLKADNYGYEISKAIENISRGQLVLKDATLYTAFRRMEQDGLISSYWGDGDGGGARRRYYKITAKGKDFYEFNKNNWLETVDILNELILGGRK